MAVRVPPAAHPGSGAEHAAATFAALGDRTRLSLVSRLGRGGPWSISQLTHGSHLTRQAITKHLRVLERARIVRCVRSGRHRLFALDPQPVLEIRDYLDRVSDQWDQALSRLRAFVEDGTGITAPAAAHRARTARAATHPLTRKTPNSPAAI
ncbi:MAG TPA: helix-turn-helix transcriptional regulator [Acidobacteriaceae bacterium]|nr:helix-turn-helix transcriptional regulator [Acidobacteriaceae bacterium]